MHLQETLVLLMHRIAAGFVDDFNRADGPPGNGWNGGTISGNRLVIAPTLGIELVTNGSFSAWTGDNPDGWTVLGESGIDPMVTQVNPAGSAGTGAARMYTTSASIRLQQSILTAGQYYQTGLEITARVNGGLLVRDASGGLGSVIYSSTGTKLQTGRAVNSVLDLIRNNAPFDMTLDNVTARLLTTSTLFACRSESSVNGSSQANITCDTNMQAGIAHYADANNFVIAYLDMAAGNLKLEKRIGGTYTTLATVGAAYAAGAPLKLTRTGTTYAVTYNGTTLIAATSVNDSVMSTALNWGLFSTYSGNLFDQYERAAG